MPAPEVAFGIAGAQAGWLAASNVECWIVVTCVLQRFRNNCYGAFPMLCVCLLAPEQFFLWCVLTARTYVKGWTEESPHAVLQNKSIRRLQVAVCSVYVTVCHARMQLDQFVHGDMLAAVNRLACRCGQTLALRILKQ